jgi:hypothetical protein
MRRRHWSGPATGLLIIGVVMLLTAVTAATASAQYESASPSASPSSSPARSATASPSETARPSPSVEPSGSPLPDAHITLEPFTETIPFRTWAIAVTGGSASVEVLEVVDGGSGFEVIVFGQSATVELTLTLPPELVLVAECFDFDNQVTIGGVEPPQRLVLEVVQGGSYTCSYGSECAGPSGPPQASVGLSVSTVGFDAAGPWAISVTGGRAVSLGCSPRRISSLTLVPDPEITDTLFGAFNVEPVGESATVEITAPRPKGAGALVAADCEDQDSEGLLRDVLVPPRRLVFDVVPLGFHICYVQGHPGTGTVPPTDTVAERRPGPPSGLWPMVFAVLAGVIAGSLLLGVRARRDS